MDVQKAIVLDPEIPKSVDKAIENLTDKPTKEAGNTFADLWYLVFGGISERAGKKRLRVAKNIENYKNELCSAVDAIPEDRRQEAKLQIAGPALQKSQYCVEEKELRDMFVKLISRSMDKSYNSKIRPSFSEIISQMTPLDAQNLELFGRGYGQSAPVCEYRLNQAKGGYTTVKTNVFLRNSGESNIDIQASSISELSRLGLISISYDEYAVTSGIYDVFEQHPVFQSLKRFIVPTPEGGYQSPRDDTAVMSVTVQKGLARLTPLGLDFLDVCLTNIIEIG